MKESYDNVVWSLVPKEKYTSPLEKQIKWHFTF